jgi:hypothetical protein
MGIRPSKADDFPAAAAMLTRDDRPMGRHQSVGSPAGLQHCCVHGPTAAGCPRLPPLYSRDPLQRFIRAQEHACHLPTDMVKTLSTTKHLTIGSQTTADRLGHTNQPHHGCPPVSGGSPLLCVGSRSSGKAMPRTVVGTHVDVSPSSRRCKEGLLNIFILQKLLNVV